MYKKESVFVNILYKKKMIVSFLWSMITHILSFLLIGILWIEDLHKRITIDTYWFDLKYTTHTLNTLFATQINTRLN